MPILRLEGKQKFNQNRSAPDRRGVIAGLRALGSDNKNSVLIRVRSGDSSRFVAVPVAKSSDKG